MLRWLIWLVLLPLRLPLGLVRRAVEQLLPCTALELKLTGPLPDVAPAGPFNKGVPSLLSLILALEHAERDPKLRRVVVSLDGFAAGLGRAEELRDALYRVRQSGKEVVVIADTLNLASYWVALGASRIILTPAGALDLTGIASHFTLFKGLLDKAGIRAQLLAKGRYKSMREVFGEEQISAANREMLQSLVTDLYAQLETRIAEGRSLPQDQILSIVDQGPFRAEQAQALGLIDERSYGADVREAWKTEGGFRPLSAPAYLRRKQRRWLPTRLARVALLEVEGNIALGKDNAGPLGRRSTGARSFLAHVERTAEDRRFAAILLRVNSPGGSALASDLMWHALGRAKKDRPLIVSMGDVAASGGYYVSGVRGARIFANPSTLTGSIGVVGGKIQTAGLYNKLGIGHELVSIGKNAAFHAPTSEWNSEQLAKMQSDIDALYQDFVEKMALGRGVEVAALDAVAQGRVWTGAQAQTCGLVDELGGFRAALGALRRELGLKPTAQLAFVIAPRPNAWQMLRSRFGAQAEAASWIQRLRLAARGEAELPLDELSAQERLWLRMPFDLRFL